MFYYLCYLLWLRYWPDIQYYLDCIYSGGGGHSFFLFYNCNIVLGCYCYFHLVDVDSTRVSNFYIIPIDYFAQGVIFLKCLFIKFKEYFPIWIFESLQSGGG